MNLREVWVECNSSANWKQDKQELLKILIRFPWQWQNKTTEHPPHTHTWPYNTAVQIATLSVFVCANLLLFLKSECFLPVSFSASLWALHVWVEKKMTKTTKPKTADSKHSSDDERMNIVRKVSGSSALCYVRDNKLASVFMKFWMTNVNLTLYLYNHKMIS